MATVFRKQARGKIVARVVAEREPYRSALLPGFELALSRLFAVADRWDPRR